MLKSNHSKSSLQPGGSEMAFPPRLPFDGGYICAFEQRHLTPRYVSWLNDPEVVRYSEQRHMRHTLTSCQAYFDSFRGSDDLFLAIEAVDPPLGHIGNISVTIDLPNAVADMSILVGERRAWGTGLGSRAWCAVLKELLARPTIRKITAGTMAANSKMLRLMERSGMTIEGGRSRQFLLEGNEVDLVLAAKFGGSMSE
jgi:RimJ/RimL family protein N-acetyltransferase